MRCSKGLSSRISDATYIDSKILDITDFYEICVDDSSAHSFQDLRGPSRWFSMLPSVSKHFTKSRQTTV